MVLAVCEDTAFIVADGASTNRKTEGANPEVAAGLRIRQFCVEMKAGNPPVLVGIHIVVNGKPVEIKTAWVRGGHEGALRWSGDWPVPKLTSLFFSAQNDTGAQRDMTAHWLTEAA